MTTLDICKAGFGIVVGIFAGIFLVHGLAQAQQPIATLKFTQNTLAKNGQPILIDQFRVLIDDAETNEIAFQRLFPAPQPEVDGLRMLTSSEFAAVLQPGKLRIRMTALCAMCGPEDLVVESDFSNAIGFKVEPVKPDEPEAPVLRCFSLEIGPDLAVLSEKPCETPTQ